MSIAMNFVTREIILLPPVLVPLKTAEEALKEVEEINQQEIARTDPSSDKKEMDEKIKILVAGLRRFGIHTSGSCQGHLEDLIKHTHPWILVYNCCKDGLLLLVWLWQKQSRAKIWVVVEEEKNDRNGILFFRHQNLTETTVNSLQEDAENFGKFLLEITGEELPYFSKAFLVEEEEIDNSCCPQCQKNPIITKNQGLIITEKKRD